jgi:hypothetical protein
MTGADIIRRRLRNQLLAGSKLTKPADVVSWFGAVQGQEYTPTKWSLGMRAPGIVDADVERAFASGEILRTHVMRQTWHLVAPADIRWILSLTGPRVVTATASYSRRLELDAPTLSKSYEVIARALEGGRHLTRPELGAALASAGIAASGQRLAHLMHHAELRQLVCSGPRRARQFTYALFDERVPRARAVARDAALGTLARRYFTSHGPATIRDFIWWSGLTTRDAREGVALATPRLAQETVDGKTYWFDPSTTPARVSSPFLYLLPIYDEFGIAYRDRDLFTSGARILLVDNRFDYYHLLFIDGRLAGRWRRTENPSSLGIEVKLFKRLKPAERAALEKAATRYGKFFNQRVTVTATV